jgi:hypothetical protein
VAVVVQGGQELQVQVEVAVAVAVVQVVQALELVVLAVPAE